MNWKYQIVLCVVSLKIIYWLITSNINHVQNTSTVSPVQKEEEEEHKRHLCIQSQSQSSNKCPEYIMTVEERGNVGNLMTQYATLYGISVKYGYMPIIPQVSKR